MHKYLTSTVAALVAIGTAVTPVAASAQWRDHDRDGVPDRYDRHDDRGDWRDRRDDRRDWRGDRRDWRDNHRQAWRYYGGRYGYNGYDGRWRTGQRFSYWRDNRYYISDYGRYGLPAPWRGYRYYRDDNGDIVMAAIATGMIGLIVGGALAR